MSKREASTGADAEPRSGPGLAPTSRSGALPAVSPVLAGEGRSSVTAVDKLAPRPANRPTTQNNHPAVPVPTPISSAAVGNSAGTGAPLIAGERTPTGRSHPGALPTTNVGLHATVNTPPAQLVRLGRYQIVERIATGGMAEVYLGVHGELAGFRTPVVLKKVLPHLASNQQFIDMFLDEARIASLLDHPNVVRIYEVGRSGAEYFLAMELVQGKSLSALLRKASASEGATVEPRLAALIIAQSAAGLHHAHNLTDPLGNPLGLVHRDVSPQNILISFEGSVKVIDFGIARALGRISETQTGGMKGKFGYMSPEQARGEEVDLRTDIFALGVVLWEAVTGRRLFNRENDLATMRALVYEPIPKPSSVAAIAPDLESIIMRALSRNPKLRYQTARDMATALERYVVSAGGASVTDLGTLMKSFFAADHSTWQQTLRTAVNLPAVTEADLAAASTPVPVPITTTAVAVVPGRSSYVFVGAGLLAVAIVVGGWLWSRAQAPPPPVAAPAPAPALQPAPAVQSFPPPPSEPTPSPSNAAGSGAEGAEPRDTAKSKNTRRRRTPSTSPRPRPAAPAKVDRRPNPF